MISASATAIVRDTLPAISAAIGDITPIFYQRMFAAHPELEQDLFNRGNQAQGGQQKALAGAIGAYATLLVRDDAPSIDAMLNRIANKHASLGIAPEQYSIVHQHLFEAIGIVLGDAATHEVVDAWSEVYWDMAAVLVGRETALYARFGVEPDDVWRELRVRSRRQESPDTVSFEVANADGSPLPEALPGQYISVQVALPDGARQIRQYSLTRTQSNRAWGFTVKAEPAREARGIPAGQVSNHLHRTLFEGDGLRCSLPYGDLVLDEGTGPLVLISAGIGCTPIIGMLNHLASRQSPREITVLHADQSMARHAHRAELADLVTELPNALLMHWYEDLASHPETEAVFEGLINLDRVALAPDAQVYLCGPAPFMKAVRAKLEELGVDDANVHYEVFGPDAWLPAHAPRELVGSGA
ncbi:nitric oxide dioxygenase [Paramicrobacterium humi]|uniref:nitric oxide dioxygenase n=1 Tax=Paramicrobacterium humi TaxID=640635 RepID=A0A1H4JXU1_9MICO|nr:globin domain-containing protein [Microbacterium humi]SEB51121.1 nitric oxide dioxygenase [Microbacterium humi]